MIFLFWLRLQKTANTSYACPRIHKPLLPPASETAPQMSQSADSWSHYLEVYHKYFQAYRGRAVTVLEIGVFGGGSLQMSIPESHIPSHPACIWHFQDWDYTIPALIIPPYTLFPEFESSVWRNCGHAGAMHQRILQIKGVRSGWGAKRVFAGHGLYHFKVNLIGRLVKQPPYNAECVAVIHI